MSYDDWLDEYCPEGCGETRRDHPECSFRAGSLHCIDQGCDNPHHRYPGYKVIAVYKVTDSAGRVGRAEMYLRGYPSTAQDGGWGDAA